MFYNYNVGKLAVSIHRAESSSQLWTWDAFLYLACMYIQRVQCLDLFGFYLKHQSSSITGGNKWVQSTSLQGKPQPCGVQKQGRAYYPSIL